MFCGSASPSAIQNRRVLSLLPESAERLSEVRQTEVTAPVCPSKVYKHSPVVTSQSRRYGPSFPTMPFDRLNLGRRNSPRLGGLRRCANTPPWPHPKAGASRSELPDNAKRSSELRQTEFTGPACPPKIRAVSSFCFKASGRMGTISGKSVIISTFQSRSVWSELPDNAKRFPELRQTEFTGPAWPSKLCKHLPVAPIS